MRAVRRAPRQCVGCVGSVCGGWSSVESALSFQRANPSRHAFGRLCSALVVSQRRFGIGSQDQANSCQRMVGRKPSGVYSFMEHNIGSPRNTSGVSQSNAISHGNTNTLEKSPAHTAVPNIESRVSECDVEHDASHTPQSDTDASAVNESSVNDPVEQGNTLPVATASITSVEVDVEETAAADLSATARVDSNDAHGTNIANVDDDAVGVNNTHYNNANTTTIDANVQSSATTAASNTDDNNDNYVNGNVASQEEEEDHGDESNIRGTYIAPLRTALPPSAVELPESTFLKCIEKEITDEELRLDKEEGAPPIPPGWQMYHTSGTSVIYARRLWMPSEHRTQLHGTSEQATDKEHDSSGSQADTSNSAETVHPRRCMERHFVRVQLTARDASLDPECDIRGEHFPFCLFVQRVRPEEQEAELLADAPAPSSSSPSGAVYDEARLQAFFDQEDELSIYRNSIEVRCDVIDGELKVDHVVFHGAHSKPATTTTTTHEGESDGMHTGFVSDDTRQSCSSSSSSGTTSTDGINVPSATRSARTVGSSDSRVLYDNPFGGYPGPNLDETEEDVLDGLSSWLAERLIDDQFGEFISQYSVWVEQAEYELWLKGLRDFVAA